MTDFTIKKCGGDFEVVRHGQEVMEATRRIVKLVDDGAPLRDLLEELNCWGPQICRALLASEATMLNLGAEIAHLRNDLTEADARAASARREGMEEAARIVERVRDEDAGDGWEDELMSNAAQAIRAAKEHQDE